MHAPIEAPKNPYVMKSIFKYNKTKKVIPKIADKMKYV